MVPVNYLAEKISTVFLMVWSITPQSPILPIVLEDNGIEYFLKCIHVLLESMQEIKQFVNWFVCALCVCVECGKIYGKHQNEPLVRALVEGSFIIQYEKQFNYHPVLESS